MLKLVFEKSTKNFARYKVVSDSGLEGLVYLPEGVNQEELTFTVIGPNHPDHAEELAKITK